MSCSLDEGCQYELAPTFVDDEVHRVPLEVLDVRVRTHHGNDTEVCEVERFDVSRLRANVDLEGLRREVRVNQMRHVGRFDNHAFQVDAGLCVEADDSATDVHAVERQRARMERALRTFRQDNSKN